MKINVLHIVLSLETGGLENGIVNLVNRADNSKFQVDVLCLRAGGELIDRITNENSRILFDRNCDPSILTAVAKINRACRENHYDIVHSHGWATMLPAYISRLTHPRCRLINGEHGTIYINSVLQKQIQRFLFKRMDLNLSVSVELAKTLCHLFKLPLSCFKPIINGVDVNRFRFDPASRADLRAELGIGADDFVVGSVGRLVPVKNYPCLIRAFSRFAEDAKNARLLLVGEGDERDRLEKLIAEYAVGEMVILAGRRDNIPALLSTMDVFVLPSFKEGLSNTILEALSCSLPTIASNVGGNPELIRRNIIGELFEVDNDAELAGYLGKWHLDRTELKRLSINARAHIEENFSLDAMVGNYESTYLEITGGAVAR